MYKALSPSVLKEMTDDGLVFLTIQSGWEPSSPWSAKPHHICYQLGTDHEHIFSCYYMLSGRTVRITNIKAAKIISKERALIDAYMYIALKGLIRIAKEMGAVKLVVDSQIPSIADHMLDLGFISGAFSTTGCQGFKTLKE